MKPDPRRLEPTGYPFMTEIPTRFGDMDALRHLNNVALAQVYEEGRVRLHRSIAVDVAREKGARTVVVQVTLRYLAEGFYPAPLQVAGGISRIGGSSYEIAQALFQDGRCIGLCDTVIVYTRDRGSAPLPGAYRALLQPLLMSASASGE